VTSLEDQRAQFSSAGSSESSSRIQMNDYS